MLTAFPAAMASRHNVLLLWIYFIGFCFPFVLLVSLMSFESSCTADRSRSMRYSRMLEESSFANKRADYFWLLSLSSVMLLVRTHVSSFFNYVLTYGRLYPRFSICRSSPLRWLSFLFISGQDGIRRPPYLFLVCSPSRHHIYLSPLWLSRGF